MKRSCPVDLYLGGPQGAWALEHVTAEEARIVCRDEPQLAAEAGSRGFTVVAGDPHDAAFQPAPACLSVHFQQILKSPLLSRYARAYNLHPGLLPWGRGYYPVFWALWERTPAGATLHAMVEGVDEGPVVAQTRVEYTEADSGGSLHARVMAAERALFLAHWPRIVSGEALPAAPQSGAGSRHTRADFLALREPSGWEGLAEPELQRLVRCLTFAGYPNLQFQRDGRAYEWGLSAEGSLTARELV